MPVPSMRAPRVYQLNFIIKIKKGGSRPLLGTSDPEKMGFPSECRPPVTSTVLTIKDGADAAAFETIRIGLYSASEPMYCLRCT
jgi:hypothetical protein